MKNFQYPTTSLFTPEGREIVAFSVEEYAAKIEQGCTDERPAVVEVIAEPAPKAKRGKAVISISPDPEAA